jgi:hypothetical protein
MFFMGWLGFPIPEEKTRKGQFSIIAFVIRWQTPDLKTNNPPMCRVKIQYEKRRNPP